MIMAQLLLTINLMHKCGIVHRDLKPDNILIKQINKSDYEVKVADFGLAAKIPEKRGKL